MDGQTDRQTQHNDIGRACIASRGKKEKKTFYIYGILTMYIYHSLTNEVDHGVRFVGVCEGYRHFLGNYPYITVTGYFDVKRLL